VVERVFQIEKTGRIAEALRGYEDVLAKPANKADSVYAAQRAMLLHYRFDRLMPNLVTRYPENRISNPAILARRCLSLLRSLRTNDKAAAGPRSVPIPKQYKLYQNYPNPFNPTTEIRFDIPEKTRVELRIFNILGQQVTTLVDEIRNAGTYQILWDGKSSSGIPVASGMYIYQLKAGSFVGAKKMILLR
jgi:hypothetical protein